MHLRTAAWLLLLSLNVAFGEQKQDKIDWQPWSDSVFAQAQKEGRFVLLNLGAVWCHWYHVMDDITYQDPEVIDLIRSHYVAVWVDEDSRPDLANRYEDYGWPATIVFGAVLGNRVCLCFCATGLGNFLGVLVHWSRNGIALPGACD